MIVVEKLSKRFGTVQVLNNLEFVAPQNQVVGFLGVNGAGKTTTMRILSTALQPSSGTVTIGGHNVVEQPEKIRGMLGYLPEKPPLYPPLSIGQYLEFLADFRELSNPRKSIGNALDKVGLLGKEGMLISKLSKGYQQRVGLAQALLHSPRYLILDEPASGLDPSQMVEIREMLKALAEETSILLSTHLLSEAERMCTHHIILHQGKVAQSGTLLELGQKSGGGFLSLSITADTWNKGLLTRLTEVEGIEKVSLKSAVGASVVLHVFIPQTEVQKVLQWCRQQELLINGYRWEEPSLEEIFLHVVGVEQ